MDNSNGGHGFKLRRPLVHGEIKVIKSWSVDEYARGLDEKRVGDKDFILDQCGGKNNLSAISYAGFARGIPRLSLDGEIHPSKAIEQAFKNSSKEAKG